MGPSFIDKGASVANIFYAHSGGVTSILNQIAASVIQESRKYESLGKVFIGKNGIIGAINNELYDTSKISNDNLQLLANSPASLFGSCRHKLVSGSADFQKIFDTFYKHDIKYFIYNGGNDSQDTTFKVWQESKKIGYDLQCIGLPKTIDNDLMGMDCCPGFGSAAKYIATSTLEAAMDVKSMCETSTKVFILEVMGRHAGWLAAASSLAQLKESDPPHIILMPEVVFDKQRFLEKVALTIEKNKYCVVVASEGIKFADGGFVSSASTKDAFGHQQLGGVAPRLSEMVKESLGVKLHWAVADYLQRSAGHIRSKCDVEQAKALATHAVKALAAGESGKVFVIKRTCNEPYNWNVDSIDIDTVANAERKIPENWIAKDKMHVTTECREYMRPWISGEEFPGFKHGIPNYITDITDII